MKSFVASIMLVCMTPVVAYADQTVPATGTTTLPDATKPLDVPPATAATPVTPPVEAAPTSKSVPLAKGDPAPADGVFLTKEQMGDIAGKYAENKRCCEAACGIGKDFAALPVSIKATAAVGVVVGVAGFVAGMYVARHTK
jgi:hypothetical protein